MAQKTDPNEGAFSKAEFYHSEHGIDFAQMGLTKREYFAAMAMQGISANVSLTGSSFEKIAEWSVKQAEALIEALNK